MGRKLKKHGIEVRYLLSKYYRWMHKEPLNETYFITKSSNWLTMLMDSIEFFLWRWIWLMFLFEKQRPDFLCIYNPHPVNFAVIKLAKLFSPNGVRAIYLHEPAAPYKKAYRFKARLFLAIVESCQKLALTNSSDVILPSPKAMELFEEYFPNYHGSKHYAPLLISDHLRKAERKRQYFSMIGRFNFFKRLDIFIDTINYVADKGEDFKFQIVTASDIEKYLHKLTSAGRSKTYIVRKKKLADEDIYNSLAGSIAVLSLQPVITQSGVVPVAFMQSTPVIALSDPGFTQFVRHRVNGWILPKDFSIEDIIEAMKSVRNNFETLSANARESYLEQFYEQNWDKHYSWLVKKMNK